MEPYSETRTRLLAAAPAAVRELFDRKSVRAFQDRLIDPQAKELILCAAAEAPSAGCQQLYTVLDITDQTLKERLAVTCDNQPFIAQAPLVLIFCADCKKWLDCYEAAGCEHRQPGVGDLMLAVVDASVAAQNAVTAAWSLGVGSCYIGDILEQYEQHRELLGLPDYVLPAAMVVFGYPTEQQFQRPKPLRFDQGYTVCENTYPQERDCRGMLDQRRGDLDYATWTARFCDRKYNSDFSREMTRSVEEYLKQYR
ncbi:MAG: nitroreductase family protein [Clostridiales bacterium]|nr:nitroreductase family protein [Clostridiales bacterium]